MRAYIFSFVSYMDIINSIGYHNVLAHKRKFSFSTLSAKNTIKYKIGKIHFVASFRPGAFNPNLITINSFTIKLLKENKSSLVLVKKVVTRRYPHKHFFHTCAEKTFMEYISVGAMPN